MLKIILILLGLSLFLSCGKDSSPSTMTNKQYQQYQQWEIDQRIKEWENAPHK